MNRREFLAQTAVSGGAITFGGDALQGAEGANAGLPHAASAPNAMRLLILGGTGFIGPHFVHAALERGHKVAVFNRGTGSVNFPPEVQQLVGDRNGNLDAIKKRDWDAVLDLSVFLPKWVRTVGHALRGHVGHYTFVSSSRVYGDLIKPGTDETGRVLEYKGDSDPFALTSMPSMVGIDSPYGGLKAISEQEAERQFPAKTLIVRPSMIIGPRDDRFTYWVVRLDRGGEVLAPGDPLGPQQLVDARDLAQWSIRAVESKTTGIYNIAGDVIGMAEMLGAIRGAFASSSRLTWVPEDWLLAHKVNPSEIPAWFMGYEAGRKQISNLKSRAAGFSFRPLAATFVDTLNWYKSLPADHPGVALVGWRPEREQQVLAAWHSDRRSQENSPIPSAWH
jgi:2'-hydroxyisoflavone reductase